MNLLEIRKQILELSGRSDLVDVDTYADLGIGYYITAAQSWLDSRLSGKRTKARTFVNCKAGTYTITIPPCRSIHAVWIYDDESRVELTKKSISWLAKNYSGDWRSLESGQTKYYAPSVIQLSPDPSKMTIAEGTFAANFANVIITDATVYEGIVVLPPPSSDCGIEVIGNFYSNPLVANDDKNWWTVNFPAVFIQAVLRQIEITHRNTQGVNDWSGPLADMLTAIDFDQVEEEIIDLNQMEG